MANRRVAMSLAEGRHDYTVDVDIILNNGRDHKDYVLRTCLDDYDHWKAKYCKAASPFVAFISGTEKKAAILDREVWVFGINGTVANDIVIAVQIAMQIFKVSAQEIIGDVYVKNLNTEGEREMLDQTRLEANKQLYTGVCQAIREAARILGCSNPLKFWVFSNNKNPKIPQAHLHEALRAGGATSVETDETSKHAFKVGDNAGGPGQTFKSHLHLAVLDI